MPLVDEVSAQDLHHWLDHREAILVDVREPLEFQEEHIADSHLHPMSTFDSKQLPVSPKKKMVFYCQGGMRSARVAMRYKQEFPEVDVYNLKGGLLAWKEAEFPLQKEIEAEREVQRLTCLYAGSATLTGSLLGAFVHTVFLVIPLFVGSVLLWCGLSRKITLSYLLSKIKIR